ncbi:serine hydrolase domain-containing protein [Bacillus sp. SCS-151]|uniref:serine hydrolase domain-containing protein n=1 Tax=Nanhaiella sioensis TaxID=3115293 RepID=UPI0039789105
MNIDKKITNQFNSLLTHVRNSSNNVNCTGSSVMVIHKNKMVLEKYWGKHSKAPTARLIQEDSQFHVASVRKCYIGFAVAYAVYHGFIKSIDDEVTKYLPMKTSKSLQHTLIRHLLTHTHGLMETVNGTIVREFLPGENWAYRNIGVNLLTQIVKNTTGKTVAQILNEQVFRPLELNETGWYGEYNDKLVEVIRDSDRHWSSHKSEDGDKMNMYVSTRELAYWGYIHLKQGEINGKQLIDKELLRLATSLQSPKLIHDDLPQNGFLWFVKDLPAKKTEIGALVPQGSYQILGYTNVAVLVIPKYDTVAVRMFNSFGSSPGNDYLADIRSFGDTVMKCLGEG